VDALGKMKTSRLFIQAIARLDHRIADAVPSFLFIKISGLDFCVEDIAQ
jgi:hypothetical protein